MADNAIEKLHEEISKAEAAAAVARERHAEVYRNLHATGAEVLMTNDRLSMLRLALHKHVNEGMPVIQAKMIAHQEAEDGAVSGPYTFNPGSGDRTNLPALATATTIAAIDAVAAAYAVRSSEIAATAITLRADSVFAGVNPSKHP